VDNVQYLAHTSKGHTAPAIMLVTAEVNGSLFLVVSKGTVRKSHHKAFICSISSISVYEVCSWSSVALCLCQIYIVIFGVILCDAFGSVVFGYHIFRICCLIRVCVRKVSKSLANILKPSGLFTYQQV
jgi:hypothetical protein